MSCRHVNAHKYGANKHACISEAIQCSVWLCSRGEHLRFLRQAVYVRGCLTTVEIIDSCPARPTTYNFVGHISHILKQMRLPHLQFTAWKSNSHPVTSSMAMVRQRTIAVHTWNRIEEGKAEVGRNHSRIAQQQNSIASLYRPLGSDASRSC